MDINDSIKVLAKQGIHVDKIGKNQFKIWLDGGEVCSPWVSARSKRQEGVWTGREVVQWAKNPHHISKGNLKHFDASKNRRETRDLISKRDFDSIPQKGKAKEENKWSWD